jgi:hypothetical protein
MTDLQRAVNVLEEAGFHVSRAYEESSRDSQRDGGSWEWTTGALCLRVIPQKPDAEGATG